MNRSLVRMVAAGVIAAGIAAVTLATSSPVQADARTTRGSVLLTSGSDAEAVVTERAAACAVELAGERGQGVSGWVVAVTPGAEFGLESGPTVVAGTSFPSHLQVVFYAETPTCAAPGSGRTYRGSSGTVPAEATVGIITARTSVRMDICRVAPCIPPSNVTVTPGTAVPFAYNETDPAPATTTTTTSTTKPCKGKKPSC